MIKRDDFEIMAPVGSYESLMAAIQGGANSVYFGIEKMNMRAHSSNNFTFNDLENIVNICNENKIKSYLTVNTVIYDSELPLMREIIDAAKKNKVTAIIASDWAVINYAHKVGVEVHISTQLNVSNIESLRFFAQYADVIVLARELTLGQIAGISSSIKKENIKGPSGNHIKIELFVHGALCMAISGKCYLSLHEKNYSANRGSCLQTCRKAYTVTEKESGYQLEIDNEYIMSPKDLMTINFLNKVLDAGVTVLKIEGRARPPEYVKTVSECYNEAIHAYIQNDFTEESIIRWQEKLATVFNRGFWGGYYLGQKMGEWSHKYGSRATKRKIYIGKGTNYFAKLNVAEFLIETNSLSVGDEILITGPTTGVIETTVSEIRVDLKTVETTQKGERCSIPVPEIVRRSDKLYKIVDADKVKQQ
ncbi:MAG: collagenase [Bacteroidetes bacterium GWC2_33_15]|nr:MAG: collagenase [Bacteroidetes bacterium GWA2_33_15]OFX50848.1 MAG: collagenase [Bacteroidetes bacterium GWC2_33_15]OFX62869.1 MAG: collagenase [Bacteroidetes bacterium GWB2_32_14]OFX69939.1 MAG: collagenase [Bacteroidetes bacterium GWD2_33_33]HAN18931.1 collagenase-like protease [Bacteroidales bacterium]